VRCLRSSRAGGECSEEGEKVGAAAGGGRCARVDGTAAEVVL
jgi:hypothetical protein